MGDFPRQIQREGEHRPQAGTRNDAGFYCFTYGHL